MRMTVALESRCRIDAVTPCRYSIDMGAGRGSAGLTLRERLLAERFHRAPLVALGGVELAPALDNHGDVGRPVVACIAPWGCRNAEYEAEPPAHGVGRAAEAYAQATAVGPCAPFAEELLAPPVDIGINGAPHPRAQVAALAGQAMARRCSGDRPGRALGAGGAGDQGRSDGAGRDGAGGELDRHGPRILVSVSRAKQRTLMAAFLLLSLAVPWPLIASRHAPCTCLQSLRRSPLPWRAWPNSTAISFSAGTARPAPCSRTSTRSCGSRSSATRASCCVVWTRRAWSAPPLIRSTSSAIGKWSSTSTATSRRPNALISRWSPTSAPSTAFTRASRSTPVASGSWRAITARHRATSASTSSTSGCFTGSGISPDPSLRRAGARPTVPVARERLC